MYDVSVHVNLLVHAIYNILLARHCCLKTIILSQYMLPHLDRADAAQFVFLNNTLETMLPYWGQADASKMLIKLYKLWHPPRIQLAWLVCLRTIILFQSMPPHKGRADVAQFVVE